MTQLPLFDTAPLTIRTDAETRLQALVDSLWTHDALIVVRLRGGWYLAGEARYFGDDGLDYLGRTADEAERALWQMARYQGRGK